ncbi:renin/prorenin receptor [Planoprotostelium fungivorum]|uniref:Renin/prorenin receptor n=1 Tax=Planoprotostelium fungivorum TaxID=1890364 RepID=A0A2P6NBN4_9EUKA|nr:renin/prorenin receptor [Planoprotostelium fungivorum]
MKGAAVLLLATALVGSLAIPQIGKSSDLISNAYFEGRSADIIVSSDLENADELSAFIPSNKFIQSWPANAQLEEKSFADLVSSVMGGPVINENTDRRNFPDMDLFNKASANVMFFVDGVSQDEAKTFSFTKQDGSFVPLVKTSYPEDSIATAATLTTGFNSKDHGIVGADWHTRKGLRTAYKSGALPIMSSISDIFAQEYKDRVSVLSISSDFQLASAFGVHPYTQSAASSNHASLYIDNENEGVSDVYAETSAYQLTKNGLMAQIVLLGEKLSLETEMDLDTLKFTVGGATFDLTIPQHLNFFNELVAVAHAVDRHVQTKSELNMYYLSFSSLKQLKTVANKDQMRVAARVIDEIISDISSQLKSVYGDKLCVEYVFAGETLGEKIKRDGETQMMSYLAINGIVPSKSVFDHHYPEIYVFDNSKVTAETCYNLEKKLFNFYHVDCPTVENRLKRSYVPTADGIVEDNFAAYFHILLWFNILLFLVAFFAVYALCSMDVGSDSLLYRMTTTARRN